jgi:hypothetical protein
MELNYIYCAVWSYVNWSAFYGVKCSLCYGLNLTGVYFVDLSQPVIYFGS